MVASRSRRYCASEARPGSGFASPSTVYPALCSLDVTADQLEPSAHAPCTSTMVGLTYRSLCRVWALLPGAVPMPSASTPVVRAAAPARRAFFGVRMALSFAGVFRSADRRTGFSGDGELGEAPLDRRGLRARRHANLPLSEGCDRLG